MFQQKNCFDSAEAAGNNSVLFSKTLSFSIKNIFKTHINLSKCEGNSLDRTQKMRKWMIKVIEPINLASLKLPKLAESLIIKGII